jgi:hypothetical protein
LILFIYNLIMGQKAKNAGKKKSKIQEPNQATEDGTLLKSIKSRNFRFAHRSFVKQGYGMEEWINKLSKKNKQLLETSIIMFSE